MLAQGPDVVPIPGTSHPGHLEENVGALDLALDEADLAAIEGAVPADEVAGDRYDEALGRLIDR